MKTALLSSNCPFAIVLWTTLLVVGCSDPAQQSQEVVVGSHLLISHPVSQASEAELFKGEPVTIEPSEEFYLEYALGSGDDGYDILKVHGDGASLYTYWDKGAEKLRQAKEEFTLDPDQVKAICDKINQSQIVTLGDEYLADVPSGKQIALTIVSGDYEKEVYCDSHFPPPVVELANYLEVSVIPKKE
ncbi:hypothetical protein AB1L30_18630 [Bremerella sp. JC817]|uniref:hypothetical protein n=1 Tax=Bremerella sp. JC817 TaxID=3231756 RepID=UPI00345ACC6C